MADQENHFTIFIRLPFKRGDFVDPRPVTWSATKERELWDIISRQSKGNEIDWRILAEQFQVTQQFLLQQAAWLYERQLSQVRAQMRRMGNRQSATASPAPGSAAGSMIGTPTSKRPLGFASRGPSRLSTQIPTSTTPVDTSVPSTPARSKTSLPLKSATTLAEASNKVRGQPPSSRPLSRRSSKDYESSSRTQSRRGSIQYQASKSPAEIRPSEPMSSSEDETTSKPSQRRPNITSAQRRTTSSRKPQHAKPPALGVHQLQEHEEDEGEDEPAFLPFANTSTKIDPSASNPSDPGATLKGGLIQAPTATASSTATSTRPTLQRNHTSERVRPASSNTNISRPHQNQPQPQMNVTSSNSSLSSSNSPYTATKQRSQAPSALPQQSSRTTTNLPTPLSPRQQAALAAAAGLSPRRRSVNPTHGGHTHTGSESSPSMGSSFSDLDDASVTQSALEEALMSNMNALGSTAATVGGGLGSRVSGISQALRSRYFDARSGNPGANNGNNGNNSTGAG